MFYLLDALGTASYSSVEINGCDVSYSVAISNDAFVKDMFHCELFCYFKDEFIHETQQRLNNTLMTTT